MNDRDRTILRELAKKQRELADHPDNLQRRKDWFAHNAMDSGHPRVVIETDTFYGEIAPALQCEDPMAREMEAALRRVLVTDALIGDDRVVPDFFPVDLRVDIREFGLENQKITAADSDGRQIGYRREHPIQDLERDFEKLGPSTFSHNLPQARSFAAAADDLIGDILPARIQNQSLLWHATLTQKVVDLMGMEQYFLCMYDCPDALHRLMAFLVKDYLSCVAWQEQQGILTPNWGNEHAGSNSYGFTTELPGRVLKNDDLKAGATDITLNELWLNINSQETVGVSADMFSEFVLPYYKTLCKRAGLVYYGCCEPVDGLFTDCLDTIPNLRKLSISAWCNEESIAEQINGKKVVYSRKPSANILGVGANLDEDKLRQSIMSTLKAVKGNPVEFIFRDVYTLDGNPGKLHRAVEIVRQCFDVH